MFEVRDEELDLLEKAIDYAIQYGGFKFSLDLQTLYLHRGLVNLMAKIALYRAGKPYHECRDKSWDEFIARERVKKGTTRNINKDENGQVTS